jgi:hypothetical protein
VVSSLQASQPKCCMHPSVLQVKETQICNYLFFPSRKSDSRSAGLESLRRLWNPQVHYSVYKSPPLARTLSHINRYHIFTILRNIMLQRSAPRSNKRFFPSEFPTETVYGCLMSQCILHILPTSFSLISSP